MQLLLLDKGDGDNTIYLDEARAKLVAGPTLVMLPVRLGMHTIDASYIPKVGHLFSFPQSVGFIGGRETYVVDAGGKVAAVHNAQLDVDSHVTIALDAIKNL